MEVETSLMVSSSRMLRRIGARRPPRRRKKLETVALVMFCLFLMLVLWASWTLVRNIQKERKIPPLFNTNDMSLARKAKMKLAYRSGWVGIEERSVYPCDAAFSTVSRFHEHLPAEEDFPALSKDGGVLSLSDNSEDCSAFRKRNGYDRYPTASKEELDFPLAFILLFHKDFYQVHLLLRALYHPHNVYCLHPDAKAERSVHDFANRVAECVPNVFIATKLETVIYAGFSRLQADLNCMEDLMAHPVQWKYVINTPGQQFPLRTNKEMVEIIKRYNGANDIHGSSWKLRPRRYQNKHILVHRISNITGLVVPTIVETNVPNTTPAPFGLRMIKGYAYMTASRAFIRFVQTDTRVGALLEWLKDGVFSPDEYLWAMVNHNPSLRAPGRYGGIPQAKTFMTIYTKWKVKDVGCPSGFFVRNVCIISADSLSLLLPQPELFANKFHLRRDPSSLHCMDQLIYNRTMSDHLTDMDSYEHLKFSWPTNRRE